MRDDDEAWQAIVDNFGDRAELSADEERTAQARLDALFDDSHLRQPVSEPVVEDTFVPPPPPPVVVGPPARMVSWAGVLGAPVVILLVAAFSISLPSWMAALVVAWFIGGFGYLVATMPREREDPYDDGARL